MEHILYKNTLVTLNDQYSLSFSVTLKFKLCQYI